MCFLLLFFLIIGVCHTARSSRLAGTLERDGDDRACHYNWIV